MKRQIINALFDVLVPGLLVQSELPNITITFHISQMGKDITRPDFLLPCYIETFYQPDKTYKNNMSNPDKGPSITVSFTLIS